MCGGCQIAEQMILQLEPQGEEVRLFAILDTWVLEFAHRKLGISHPRFSAAAAAWLRNASMREGVRLVQKGGRSRVRAWTGKTKAPAAHGPTPIGHRISRRHDFKAPVVLFKRPKQPYYYVDDPTMGWGPRTEGGIQIYEITAKHHEFLREPHTEFVGKIIMSRLKTHRTNAEDPGEACESTRRSDCRNR